MKKGCLSEEIFEGVSNEESHYKRRSFDGKQSSSSWISMTKTLYFAELILFIQRGTPKNEYFGAP